MSKFKIAVGAIGGLLAVVALVAVIFGIQWFTAPFRGEMDAREQIQADGDFRIQAYQGFFDMCASVQGHESRIASLEQELETDPPQSRVTTIQASLSAIRSQRADLIHDYNSEASRDWTEGQFQDENLPYRLSEHEENTECE